MWACGHLPIWFGRSWCACCSRMALTFHSPGAALRSFMKRSMTKNNHDCRHFVLEMLHQFQPHIIPESLPFSVMDAAPLGLQHSGTFYDFHTVRTRSERNNESTNGSLYTVSARTQSLEHAQVPYLSTSRSVIHQPIYLLSVFWPTILLSIYRFIHP